MLANSRFLGWFALLALVAGCPGPDASVDTPVGMDAGRNDAGGMTDTPGGTDAPSGLDVPPRSDVPVTGFDVTLPDVSGFDVALPDVALPDVSGLDVPLPDVSGLDAPLPDVPLSVFDVSLPDVPFGRFDVSFGGRDAGRCAGVVCGGREVCCESTGACYDPRCLACCMARP